MASLVTKIGLGGIGVFAIGFLGVTAIEAGKDKIEDLLHTDSDIRIPLKGIVPFNLDQARIGSIEYLTLLRDSPDRLSGVRVEAVLEDSVSVSVLKDCGYLTVNDPEELNDGTRFLCLHDTTGYASFGSVEVHHDQGGEGTTLRRTLLLTPAQLEGLQDDMGPRVRPGAAGMAEHQALAESVEAMTRVQVELADRQAVHARDRARGARVDRVVPPSPGADTGRPEVPRP